MLPGRTLLFNNYFQSITENLDLFEWPGESKFNIFDEIDIIINKFWSHPKIPKLKQKFSLKRKSVFKPFTEEFFKNIVNDLSWNEAAGEDIPLNLIKESTFILSYLAHCVNEDLVKSEFPDLLKLSNTVPVTKKEDPPDKTNYRLVSVLSLLAKVFENVMYEQLYEYLNNYLNDLICGFRKAHSTRHVLSRLIQSLKKELDNSGLVGTILMDLSKANDCWPQDLLIAKIEAYGLDKPSLNLVNDYLSFRKQRAKIGSSYSDWANVTRVILQRSILRPLLFNIFTNDIFFFIKKSDICKFADDNTLFSCGDNLSVILKSLEHDMKIVLNSLINSLKFTYRWFKFTYSKSGKVSIYDSSEIPSVKILSYNRAK